MTFRSDAPQGPGLAVLGAEEELDVFLTTVRELGRRAACFVPPAEGQAELTVKSAEIGSAIGRTSEDPSLALARELIINSLWEIWAGASGGQGGAWTISLVPEKARKYRDVDSLDEVLRLHAPFEAERQSWAAVVATPDVLLPEHEEDEFESSESGEVSRAAVFVVYGRNEPARAAMFDFLAALGLEPLTWEKLLATTGEAAPYVGHVLTVGFNVARAVVVLLTPDCRRRLNTGPPTPV